jgi:hypothetical protein
MTTPDNPQITNDVHDGSSLANKVWAVAADITASQVRANHAGDVLGQLPDKQDNDPAKKACPTGGCPPDTKLNKDIWEDMMQETAKEKKLDLDDPIKRREAHMYILPLFRQRFRENKKTEKQDREGPPHAQGPEFIIKDGGIYYPAFQKSLQQMYEDQKRLRPKQYNKREHATMTLMEVAFVQGATRVSHISHNRDANGNDAIRDQITMVFDPSTGKGRMEIRNIAATEGHDLSTKEAYDAIKRTHDGFIEGHPTEGIFIFTDAPIPTEEVHGILSSFEQPEAEVRHPAVNNVIPDTSVDTTVIQEPASVDEVLVQPLSPVQDRESNRQDTLLRYTRQVAVNTEDAVTQGVDGFITYIHDRQKAIPQFLQKLLDLPEKSQDEQNPVLKAPVALREIVTEKANDSALRVLTEIPVDTKADGDGEDVSIVWLTMAQKALGISRRESERLFTEVVETTQTMHDAQEVVAFVVDTDVAIGAGLFALNTLTLSEDHDETAVLVPELITSSEQHMETGSLEFITHLPQKERDLIFSFFSQTPLENHSIDIRGLVPEGVDMDVLTATIDFIRTIDALPSGEKEKAIMQEKKKTLGEIIYLWDFLTTMSGHMNSEEIHRGESATIHSPRELISITDLQESNIVQEKESVDNFSFAITVWMLLKMTGYYANLEFVHSIVAKRESDPLMQVIQKEKPAGLIQKEPAPWLLFSIIWYLAMIREQGAAQSQQQNTKYVQPKQIKTPVQVKSNFAEYGIIFAFGS